MQKKALIVANLVGFVGFLWNDIKILQSLGYEVHFAANATVISGEKHDSILKERNVIFHQVDFSNNNPFSTKNYKAFNKIKRLMRQEQFNFVHCHTPIAGFITRQAVKRYRKKGLKVAYTTHGFSFTHLSSKKQWLVYYSIEKVASKYTDVLITINEEDYRNAKRLRCDDVRMINGVGVDVGKYRNVTVSVSEYKNKLSIPADKIMVLSVGELSERKNHQIIVKALGMMEEKNNYIYVICGREVAGSGVEKKLKQLASELDIDLYLLGHRSDIPEIIHCSDIGAIPSVREGLGLAGIQSLCAGVPLVGTRVQGIKDYIKDGETGFLCDPYDAKSFMESIKKLSNSQLQESMKESCYEMALKYDTSVSYNQMEEIYDSILK